MPTGERGPVSPTKTRRGLRQLCYLGALALVSAVLVACSGNTSSSSNKAVGGATVTYAELPGSAPAYIFPLFPLEDYGESQPLLSDLLYTPLYWFSASNPLAVDPKLSLADPPVFSNDNRTVTIRLKSSAKWSDGKPVTSRDVEFWINLLKANAADYGPYVPGTFPDNLASASYPNSSTVVLHLTNSFNPTWFTGTALAEITPMPQHLWDKTSTSGAIGNYDTTTAGAHAVYNFLNAQSKSTANYSTNSLWKIVDGPFRLSQNTPNGQFVFVPNHLYFGPKPRIAKLVELPFTSADAENNEVLEGAVDYGYLPATDIPEIPRLQHEGYQVVSWPLWGVNYLYVNYTNPASGPFMKQTYVRVAMQELINEPQIIKSIYHGYGYVDDGPVPNDPKTPLAGSLESKPAYPYDPSAAVALLKKHGWHVVANGTTTCSDPAKCGAGIAAGAPLAITAIEPTGFPDMDNMMQAIQSSWTAAGIKMNIVGVSESDIGSILGQCKPGRPCKWGLINYVQGYYWTPGPYPDGGPPFGTGYTAAGGNGPFSPTLDRMIASLRTLPNSKVVSGLNQYEKYVRAINPQLWYPMQPYQISVIKTNLHGTLPQNPTDVFTPQLWYLTK